MRHKVIQHSVVFSLTPVDPSLISLSEASTVDGIMVECDGESSREDPLTITVAGEWMMEWVILIHTPTDSPSPPLNTRVSSAQNQPSFSNITLEWDPPYSTEAGGVSVSYVLTISPTPLSGSLVTVDTTSAQSAVSYNTPYTTWPSELSTVLEWVMKFKYWIWVSHAFHGHIQQLCMYSCSCVPPTVYTAAGVTITNTPPVTIGGSNLTMKWEPQPVGVVGGLLTLEPLTAAVWWLQVSYIHV